MFHRACLLGDSVWNICHMHVLHYRSNHQWENGIFMGYMHQFFIINWSPYAIWNITIIPVHQTHICNFFQLVMRHVWLFPQLLTYLQSAQGPPRAPAWRLTRGRRACPWWMRPQTRQLRSGWCSSARWRWRQPPASAHGGEDGRSLSPT